MSKGTNAIIIKEIIQETTDCKTFIFQSELPLLYQSGQFITFVFDTMHGEERRSYSFSSAPQVDNYYSITVKRIANGLASRFFIDEAQVGDVLQHAGVGGLFTLPNNADAVAHIFFIAAGSGITPIFSLIKTIRLQQPHLRITLIYSNKNKNSTVFYQQLLQLSDDSNGLFNIEFIFSDATDITKARLTNHLLTQLLHQYKTTVLEKIWCYVCGPLDYMDTVSITLLTEGILKTHIKKEIFIPYFSERVDTPPDTLPHKVKINSKQAVYELTVQYPTSILQQALLQGIQLPYSCQSGQCGSCVARCTQGKVWMAYNEVLTEREINQGWVLTCQGYPINGDITLEY